MAFPLLEWFHLCPNIWPLQVSPDLQNEVLISLLETDPDVVDYLLRRKASQSSWVHHCLKPPGGFNLDFWGIRKVSIIPCRVTWSGILAIFWHIWSVHIARKCSSLTNPLTELELLSGIFLFPSWLFLVPWRPFDCVYQKNSTKSLARSSRDWLGCASEILLLESYQL